MGVSAFEPVAFSSYEARERATMKSLVRYDAAERVGS